MDHVELERRNHRGVIVTVCADQGKQRFTKLLRESQAFKASARDDGLLVAPPGIAKKTLRQQERQVEVQRWWYRATPGSQPKDQAPRWR